tara:strand:+ start:181 stop:381 length:201 start_codon:yes stop_codon:yes gene_type:complete
MSRTKALEIVKNMERTLSTMIDIETNVHNEQFPPARMKRSVLRKMQQKLLKKYSINENEYKPSINP